MRIRRFGVPVEAVAVLLALTMVVRFFLIPSRAAEVPPSGSDLYMQTNGPAGTLGLGDWYTSDDPGTGNSYHYITLEIPCGWPANEPINIDLFSPELNVNGPTDEQGDDGFWDDTRFELYGPYDGPVTLATTLPGPGVDPDGAGPIQNLGATTYAPVTDTTSEAWDRFATLDPVECGVYLLRAETLVAGVPAAGQVADDQNAWRVRLGRDDDAIATNAPPANLDDFDGVPGTNDELSIGLVQISWQQDSGGEACLTLYEYADGTNDPLTFNNFDIDGNTRVRYYDPSAAFDPTGTTGGVAGTVSGNEVWNGGSSTARGGDSVALSETGWWRSATCVTSGNQFIQENGSGEPDYVDQPPSPEVSLTKDDGFVQTFPGRELSYTINIANAVGTVPGAAVEPTVVDDLPAGTTLVSCSWTSLPATATDSTPCSGTGGTVTAPLEGWIDAGDNAVLEIVVTVDPGTENTTLTNNATVTFEDGIGRSYVPVSASDETTVGDPNICYAIADSGDTLFTIDRPSGTVSKIGDTDTSNIEAMAINPFNRIVYAANAGRFGEIDVSDGSFTPAAADFGTGQDAAGTNRTFNDVDGLAFDFYTGILWGTERNSGSNDALFQIDPLTGLYVPDAFGDGVDYVVINGTASGIQDIDDIAIDPLTGILYGVANAGGTVDRLVTIDKVTGTAVEVNPASPVVGVTDIEGLSFFNDGSLYGVSGGGGNNPNHFFQIRTSDGKVEPTYGPDPGYLLDTVPPSSPTPGDYEALGCLNGAIDPNVISGTVFRDLDEDGVLDGGEPGEEFVAVRLYKDIGTTVGEVDGGDLLLDVQYTAADGTYRWETAALGDYVVEIEPATLPVGDELTTDNVEVASFSVAFQDDTGNDFGVRVAPLLDLTKVSDVTGPVAPGQVITYTITVENPSTSEQRDVVVTDLVPAGTTYNDDSLILTPEPFEDAYDDFNDANYGRDDGSVNFSGNWIEVGETTNATSGAVQVVTDTVPNPDEVRAVRFTAAPRSLYRSFAALTYDSAEVFWDYRRSGFDGTFTVDISNNAGSSWTNLRTYASTVARTDAQYVTDSALVPIPLTNDMRLRFRAETLDAGTMWVDDAQVRLNPAPQEDPGGDIGAGDPLIPATRIDAGESLSATFSVTVDDPTTTASIDNTASVVSRDQTEPVTASVSDPVGATIGDRIWNDLDGDDTQEAGELGLVGVTLRVYDSGADGLPGGGDDTLISTEVTGANGIWGVGGLAPGTYHVDVDETTLPAGYVRTTANEPSGIAVVAGDIIDTADVGYRAEADLELTKVVDDATVNVGESVTYTVTVTNTGPSAVTGVEVTDLVPGNTTLTNDVPSQGTYDDVTGVWTVGALAVGASATLDLTATIDDATPSTNVAEVTAAGLPDSDSTPDNGVATEDDQASATVTPLLADLRLAKTVDDAAPALDQQIAYTLTLTNDGPDDATNVEVTDLLPTGTTFVDATPSVGTYDDATGVWDVGGLAADASATLVIDVTVDVTGAIDNSAEVTAVDQADSDSTPDNDVATEDDQDNVLVTVPLTVDLDVTKTVDQPNPALNEVVTFTVSVTNDGPDGATNVVLTDVLPSGLVYVADVPSAGAFDDTTGQWTLPTLAAGATATLDLDVRVVETGASTNVVEVTAVDQPDRDSTPANGDVTEDDRSTATVTAPATVDLSLTKSVDTATTTVGQTVTFTVTVTNDGPDDATGVRVDDLLPAGLVHSGNTPSVGTYAPLTGFWAIGDLAVGATETLEITATVAAAGSITNVAQVGAVDQPDVDSTPDNDVAGEDDQDSATLNSLEADLRLTKTVNDAAPNVGDAVTFTLTLTNDGPDGATNVAVTDVLPAGLSAPTSVASQGSYDATSGVWTVGSLADGAVVTLDITATVTGSADLTNTAQVSASDQFDPDSEPANDVGTEDDQDSVLVSPQRVDLELDVAVDSPTAAFGDTITFTVTVDNVGEDDATGVVVTDVVPAGLSGVTVTPSTGTFVGNTWTIGDLNTGDTVTLTITGTAAVTGTITDEAEITAHDQFDIDSTPGNDVPAEDDQDLASVVIPITVDLSVVKVVDDATPTVGDQVVFTVTLANAGPDDASGVLVTDLLPAGLTYVSHVADAGIYDDATGVWDVDDLVAGTAEDLTITATVTATTAVTNIVEVTAQDQVDVDSTPDNDVATEDDQDDVTVTPTIADLSVTKIVDIATPDVGDEVEFTIKVANAGPDTATGVEVTDLLPAGLVFVSAVPTQGTYASGTGVWDVGTLANGGDADLAIVARVTAETATTNVAQVTASDIYDPDSTPDNDDDTEDDLAEATVTPLLADLVVGKLVDDATPNVGDVITYSVSVRNDGPDDATGVVLLDALPADHVFVAAAGDGTYDDATGLWDVGDLAVGVTAVLTIDATVDTGAPRTNTVAVDASDRFDPVSTNDAASVDVTPQQADLSVTKSVDDPSPQVDDEVTFTVAVANAGPDDATGVVVTDLLPAGMSYVSSTVSGTTTYDDASGLWSVGDVLVGGSETLTITATIDVETPVTNSAAVTAADQFDPDSTPANAVAAEDDQDAATVSPQIADLSLTKVVDDATPALGDEVEFTIVVTNGGPDTATGVEVSDVLDAGLSFVSATETLGTYDDTTGVWDVGTLAATADATLTIRATVVATGLIPNTAEVSAADQFDPDSTPGDGLGPDDLASADLTVPDTIDLSVTKTVDDDTPTAGQLVTFTVTVTNGGPDGATGVELTDQLPAGLTFDAARPTQGAYDDGTGVWTVGALGNGSTATLELDAFVVAGGTITNTAQVTGADQVDVDSLPGNGVPAEDDQASATLSPETADLELDKTVDNSTPDVGEQVTFTVTLTNQGPDTATNVGVSDLLPAGVTLVTATASQGAYDSSTGAWTVGTVLDTGVATLDLVVTVDVPGTTTNTAEVVASDQFDSDSTPGNGDATEDDLASASVTPLQADLAVLKTVDDATPNVGDTVTFTIDVSNGGPDDAVGVEVADLLPAGLTYAADTTTQGSYVPGTGLWTVGGLAFGATATLTIDATVTAAAAAATTVTNTATVDATTYDPNGANDLDGADVTPQQIDLALTKTVDDAAPLAGAEITYTLTLTNGGPDGATGVVVTDALPNGLTYTGDTPSQGTYDDVTGEWTVGSLAAAGTATLDIRATVDQLGTTTNSAEVTAADQLDTDSTPANDDDTEDDQDSVDITPPVIDLSLTKSVDETTPDVGDPVTFTITVTNAGPAAATGVVVEDVLPAGLTYTGDLPTAGAYDDATGRWTVGGLAIGASETLELFATVAGTDPVTNTAEVVAADQFDIDSEPDNGDVTEDDFDSASLTPITVDLQVTKIVDTAVPNYRDVVNFTVSVDNLGPDDATGVMIDDVLPAGLSFINAMVSQGAYDATTGVWTVGTVAALDGATLTLRAQVLSTDPLTNTASVGAVDQADTDAANDSDDASVDAPDAADLSVTKTASTTTPLAGQTVVFTVDVRNDGPDTATGVTLEDVLPANLSLDSSSATLGSYDPVTGVWTVGTLVDGQSEQLTLTTTYSLSASTTVNRARVMTSDQYDHDSVPGNAVPGEDDQDEAALNAVEANLRTTKAVDNPTPTLGDTVEYTITVTNLGPGTASSVGTIDSLDPGLTLLGSSATQGSFDLVTLVWDIGELTLLSTAELTVFARVDALGTLENTAAISSSDAFDPDPSDDAATASVDVQVADLRLTKVVDDATPVVGDDVVFTVTLDNDGPDTAPGVQVTDLLPAGLDYVSDIASVGTYDDATGVWDVGSFASGANATLAVTATVTQSGTRTNLAQVSASGVFDPDSTPGNDATDEDDLAEATIVVPAAVDLAVVKTVDDATPFLDDTIVYTVEVENLGPDDATGVTVEDLLPSAVVYVSDVPTQGSYDSGTGSWTIGNVAAGGTATLTLTATVDGSGTITNAAAVTAVDQGDIDPSNDDDEATIVVAAPASIGDTVFEDADGDGVQGVGDDGLVGVVVDLIGPGPDGLLGTADDELIETTTTVADGLYLFDRLPAGQYRVDVDETTLPPGSALTAGTEPATVTVAAGDDDDTVDFGYQQQLDLEVTKVVAPGSVTPGEQATFTVTVRNTSTVLDATGVTLDEVLPAGLSVVSSTPSAGTWDETTWDVGTIAADTTETLSFVVTAASAGGYDNTATVATVDQQDTDPSNDSDSATLLVTADGSIGDTVWQDDDGDGSIGGGEPLLENVEVSLIGPGADLVLGTGDDVVLATDTTDASGTYLFTGLLAGTYRVDVDGTTVPAGLVLTTGNDPVDVTLANDADNDLDVDFGYQPQLDLVVTKSVLPTPVVVGDTATYTVTVTNASAVLSATGVEITDTLPLGLTLGTVTASSGSFDQTTGIWTVGTLAPSASATLDLTVSAAVSGTYDNVADLTAVDQLDTDPTNNRGTATLVVTADGSIGDTVWRDDDGNGARNGVEPGLSGVDVDLIGAGPDDVLGTADDVVLDSTTTDAGGGYLFTGVPAGTYRVDVVDASVPGGLVLTTSGDPFEVTLDFDDSVVLDADFGYQPQLNLAVDKSVAPTTVDAGTSATWTILVTNESTTLDATGVELTDTLPAGVTLTGATPSQGTFNSSTGVWAVGGLAAGASATLDLVVTADEAGTIVNSAAVTAVDQLDTDPTDDGDSASLLVEPAGSIGDLVWVDVDGDGVRDVGEDGIQDVDVALTEAGPDGVLGTADDVAVGVASTDVDGLYAFVDLPRGTYRVDVVDATVPAGHTLTSVGDPLQIVLATDASVDLSADFGYQPRVDLAVTKTVAPASVPVGQPATFTVTVENLSVIDATGVQLEDVIPAGLAVGTVTPSAGTWDGGTGAWDIGSLPAGGTQTLTVAVTPTVAGDFVNTALLGDVDQPDTVPTNNEDSATLTATPAGSIGDTVFQDVDGDGSQTGGEPGIPGVTVRLLGPGPDGTFGTADDDVLDSVVTVADGFYSFTGLPTGDYRVDVDQSTVPADHRLTTANDPTDVTLASDAGVVDTVDFGFEPLIDLTVTKSVDDPQPNVGDDVTFTVTVENESANDATGVVVTDLLPAGLSYVSDTGLGDYVVGSGVWTVGALAAGASASLDITASVTTSTGVNNIAQVSAADQVDLDSTPGNDVPGEDDQDNQPVSPQTADLAVVKVVDDATPALGAVVTFTITLDNNGGDDATGVAVRDQLPAGLEYVSSLAGQGSYDPTSGVWSVGAVANGGSFDLVITARVVDPGLITNTASVVSSDQFDDDPTNDSDSADVTAPAPASVGDTIFEDLDGDGLEGGTEPGVSGVTVRLFGPGGDGVLGTGDDVLVGTDVTNSTGTYGFVGLVAGEYRVQVDETTVPAGLVRTTAPDPLDVVLVAGEDRTDVDVGYQAQADLSLTKTVDDATPLLDDVVVFTLTLDNAGPAIATGVTVTDAVPAGLTVVGSTPSQGSFDSATGVWTVGTVASGGQATLALSTEVTATGTLTNTAEVSSADQADPDSTPANGVPTEDDDAQSTIVVPPSADLSLVKTVDNATPAAGETVTWTVTVTNDGPDDATGVTVTDQLPAGLTHTADDAGGAYDETTGVWTIGALAAGSSTALQIQTTVDAPGSIVNSAQVATSDQHDRDSTPGNDSQGEDDQDQAALNALEADLLLVKQVSDPRPNVGDTITFTVTMTNNGPDPADTVAAVDDLLAGFTYLSHTVTDGVFNPTNGVWDIPDLSVGASVVLTLDVRVDTPDPLTNTATIVSSDSFDPDPTNDTSTVDVEPLVADLRVNKSVVPAAISVGESATFSVLVTNDGPDAATNVELTDVLPSGLTLVGYVPGVGSYDPVSGVWAVGDIPLGLTRTLTMTVTPTEAGTFTNIAQVTAVDQYDPDSVPANDAVSEDDLDDAVLTVAPIGVIGDLVWVDADGDGIVDPGEDGLVGVGVLLTEAGADGILGTGDDVTVGSTTTDGDGLYEFTDLPRGTYRVDVVDATVPADHQLSTAGDPFDVVLATDDVVDRTIDFGYQPLVDIVVTKTVSPATLPVGQPATFTITAQNASTIDATAVQVEDVIPSGLAVGTVTPSAGTWNGATGAWQIGSLPAGGSESLTIVVTPTIAADFLNTALLGDVDQPDSNPTNNEDSAALTATPAGSIGDTVFQDVDGDGVQTGGEPGIGGVTVWLLGPGPDGTFGTADDDVLDSAVTDGVGFYSFTGLPTGDYRVDVDESTVPADHRLTTANDPTDVTLASDAGVVDTVDFGFEPLIDLTVTKTVDDPQPNVGDDVTFTVTVENEAANNATGVVVTDLLPAGLSYVSDTGGGSYDPTSGAWDVGAVDAGSSLTLQVTATVTTSTGANNIAQVGSADQVDRDSTPGNGVPGEDDQDNQPVSPLTADLGVTKIVDDATPALGAVVTFTITLDNNGGDDATGVAVRDQLPAGLEYVSSLAGQGSYDPTSGVWSVGSITTGASVELTVSARVLDPGLITNTASVASSDQFDDDPTNDSDSADVTAPAPASVGDTIFEDLDGDGVQTAGEPGITGVTVRLFGPGGDGVLGTGDDVLVATEVTNSTGTYGFVGLVAGEYRVQVDVTTVPAGFVRTSVADPLDVVLVAGEDRTDVDVGYQAQADLSLTKTVDDAAPLLGDVVVFTLTLDNAGPATATGVAVTDAVPAGLTVVSGTPSQGAFDTGTGIWTVGTLAPSGQATLQLSTEVTATGTLTNTAEVTAADQADPDSTPANGAPAEDDAAESSVVVPASADLSLVKTVDDAAPAAGATVTWTVTVTNDGPDDATGVTVTDQLPAGLTHTGDDGAGAYDDATGVWTIGALAAGSSTALQIQTTVDAPGTIVNSAQVATSDQGDPDSTPGNDSQGEDDQDQASLNPLVADLALVKTVSDPRPNVGDTITFTVTIVNNGPDTADTIAAVDDLLVGFTYLSHTTSVGLFNPSNGVWDIDDLLLGASAVLTLDVRVDTPDPLTNTATIVSSDSFDPDPTNDTSTVDVEPLVADLRVTKSVVPDAISVGESATFSVLVTNDGPDAATNVELTDVLPAGLTLDGYIPGVGSYDPASGVWAVGDIPLGLTRTLTMTVTPTEAGTFTNIAQVTAVDQYDPDSVPANDAVSEDDLDDAVLLVAPVGVIGDTVFLDGDGDGVQGGGEPGISGVDVLLTSAGADGTLGTADDTVTRVTTSPTGGYSFTGLTAGSYEVTVDDTTLPTATLLTTGNDPTVVVLATDDATDLTVDLGYVRAVDVSISITTATTTPSIGDQVTFVVDLTNAGPGDATGVVARVDIPAGLSYVSDDGAGAYDEATSTWTVGAVPAGETATLRFVAGVVAPGSLTVPVEVTDHVQPDIDSVPGNGAASEDDVDDVTLTVIAVPGLDLDQTGTVTVEAGTTTSFGHRLTNTGDLPDNVTVAVVNDLGWPVAVHLDLDGDGVLDPGEPEVSAPIALGVNVGVDLVVVVTAPVGTPGDTTSTTTTTATSGNDPSVVDSVSDFVTVLLEVPPVDPPIDPPVEPPVEGGLAVAKTVSAEGAVTPGTIVTWTITVTNTSAMTMQDVVLRDDLPVISAYVAGSSRVDGVPVADAPGGELPFEAGIQLGPLAPDQTTRASFDTEVLEAADGTIIDNVAVVNSVQVRSPVPSNPASLLVGQPIPNAGLGLDLGVAASTAGALMALGGLLLWVAVRRREDDERPTTTGSRTA